MRSFSARPPSDVFQVNGVEARHTDGLLDAVTVCAVDVPGQPIHHALGWTKQAKGSRRTLSLGELVDRFIADRNGPGRELDLPTRRGLRRSEK